MHIFALLFVFLPVLVFAPSPFVNKTPISQNGVVPKVTFSTSTSVSSSGPKMTPNGNRYTTIFPPPQNRSVFDIIYQWQIIDYVYPTEADRDRAIRNGEFIPENNLPLGVEMRGNRLFVTTPRWKLGTPASLSWLPLPQEFENPPLIPYPDWSFHTTTDNPDCSKLLSVYRIYIDDCDRLWVIDAGVVETITNLRQVCLPKIVAFDLKTNQQIFSFELPQDQVLEGSLHTNIVVDLKGGKCEDAFAYVTDVWRYGVVVFSLAEMTSWRTTSHLHYPNPLASDYKFRGLNFQWMDGTFGLSLSPVASTGERLLFYHPMSSYMEFMVSTSVLQNRTLWENGGTAPQEFRPIGNRGVRGQSSTSGIARNGVQFHALVQRSAVGCWDIRKPYSRSNLGIVQQHNEIINFPNDLIVDHERDQGVWVLSNNLPIFLYSELDFGKINFRILRASATDAIRGTPCDPTIAPVLEKPQTSSECQ